MLDKCRSGRKFLYEEEGNFNCFVNLTAFLTPEDIFKLLFNLKTTTLNLLIPIAGITPFHNLPVYFGAFLS